MVKVRSPASATVINAISMGKGSAFGIKLYVTSDVRVLNHDEKVYYKLREFDIFNLKNITLKVETKSDIPPGSGLSSSSAASNSIVYATLMELLSEANLSRDDVDITDEDLINMGIDASLEVGVTKTGSYDDASASFY